MWHMTGGGANQRARRGSGPRWTRREELPGVIRSPASGRCDNGVRPLYWQARACCEAGSGPAGEAGGGGMRTVLALSKKTQSPSPPAVF